MELHVVDAAILECHPTPERTTLDLERGQRRILVLAETPFVGIRDELDGLGPDYLVGHGRCPGRILEFLVWDQQPVSRQFLVEPGGHQLIVVLPVDQIHLPAKVSLLAVNETGGIAEGDGRESVDHQEFRVFIHKPSRSDLIQDLRKNEPLKSPARRTWKTMLPVPGSR